MDETQYLLSIIGPLLQAPDQLQVTRTEDQLGILLMISVAGLDMGRVIGREGATVNCFRTLLRQFGAARRMHISVKIEEPVGPQNKPNKYSHEPHDLDEAIKDL